MTLITPSSHPYSLRDLRADHYANELQKQGGVLDRYTDRWRFASAENANASRAFLARQPRLMTLFAPGQNSDDRSAITRVGGHSPQRYESVRGVDVNGYRASTRLRPLSNGAKVRRIGIKVAARRRRA